MGPSFVRASAIGKARVSPPLPAAALAARATRERGRRTLARLLDAAVGEFSAHGYRGARVSQVSLQSVRDLFEFRSLLEPAAIRQATSWMILTSSSTG